MRGVLAWACLLSLAVGCGNGGRSLAGPEFDLPTTTLGSPGEADAFGHAVGFVDDRVAVGAPAENGTGQVHVYEQSGDLHLTLRSPVAATEGRFGAALASVGGDLLVGAPGEARVYLFDGATGGLVRTLRVPGLTRDAEFGAALAVLGGEVWVGAPGRDAIHRFALTSGAHLGTIATPGGAAFGSALAVVGNRVLVGAPGGVGRTYVVTASGAVALTLTSPTPAGQGAFGAAVAAAGNDLLVGAPGENRVYLFAGATGALLRTVHPPDGGTAFGAAVAFEADMILAAGVVDGVARAYGIDADGVAMELQPADAQAATGVSLAAENGLALVGVFHELAGSGLAGMFNCDSGALLQLYESPNQEQFGQFGNAVALVAGLFAVAAEQEDGGAPDAGRVYILDVDGSLVRTLVSPNPEARFGRALAAFGTTLIVGSAESAAGILLAGRVYAFDVNTGNLVFPPLVSPMPDGAGAFGRSVAASANNILVGAPGEDSLGQPESGRAYLFNGMTGALLQTFRSPNPEMDGNFGFTVADGFGNALISAHNEDAGATDAGRAYLFDNNAVLLLTFVSDNPEPQGGFGLGLAATAGFFFVGAPNEDAVFPDAGRVSVFDPTGALNRIIVSPHPQDTEFFGFPLAASPRRLAVGAFGGNGEPIDGPGTGVSSGVVHLYDAATHIRERRFVSPNEEDGGFFGTAIALDDNVILIGAQNESTAGGQDAGRAYLYDLIGTVSNASPNPTDNGDFGQGFAVLDATRIVVGAPGEGMGGVVYVLDTTGATPPVVIPNPDTMNLVGARFGAAVSVVGTNIIVGAPFENSSPTGAAGAAYLFTATGALLQTYNTPNPSGGDDLFGFAVAGVGPNVLVGAIAELTNSGRAYLFDQAGNLLQTFVSPNTGAGGIFGVRLADIGGNCLIGAPEETVGGTAFAGRAYLFNSVTGAVMLTLTANTPMPFAFFGSALAPYGGGDILVGEIVNGIGGAVYLFDGVGGGLRLTINSPEPGVPEFGTSVADLNGTILVGSRASTDGSGAAFIFDNVGNLLVRIQSGNPKIDGDFGSSVASLGGVPFVTAPFEDVNPVSAGRIYAFQQLQQTGLPPGAPQILVSPNPTDNGQFGGAVAFAGIVPIVGAPGELGDAGRVYTFDGVTGMLTSTILSPNQIGNGRYGSAIAANPLMLAIGAPGETSLGFVGAGRAYLYGAQTGTLMLSFQSANAEPNGLFGTSVAVAGNFAAVGASNENLGQGRAYYFDCATETVLTTLVSPNPVGDGGFGCAVATVGTDVFVGACAEPLTGAGRIYRFNGLSGTVLNTYISPNAVVGGAFGASLAVFGTDVIAGAPGETVTSLLGAGRAYVVDEATGMILLTLASPVPEAGGGFGQAVATDGASIFVGAPGENGGAGRVFQFDAVTGAFIEQFASPNFETGSVFGRAVAATAGNLLVGALNEDGGANNAGRAYVNPPIEPQ